MIDRFADLLVSSPSATILRAIGDDAAVIHPPRNHEILFTTDALIERVHFDLRWDHPRHIGWKAMAANISDIAAMNGKPLCAVVSVALPKTISVDWITMLYRGLHDAAKQFHAPIVGGDTVRSPNEIMISIAMLGSAPRKNITMRSGARVGDLICVSGELGTCAAALEILSKKKSLPQTRNKFFAKHYSPQPRVDVVDLLRRKNILPTAMIDISDGLISDLIHLAEESRVRCAIDSLLVPTSNALKLHAKQNKIDPGNYSLHSGEEYELAMTIPPRFEKQLRALNVLTIIGRIEKGNGVIDISTGSARTQVAQGFQHF